MKAIELIKDDFAISPYARFFKKHNMMSAAIFYKNLNESIIFRSSNAICYLLENVEMPEYKKGTRLPMSAVDTMEMFEFEKTSCFCGIRGNLEMDIDKFGEIETISAYEEEIKNIIIENHINTNANPANVRFNHGGIHNVIDFEFILKNGLQGLKARVLENYGTSYEEQEFSNAMFSLVDAISDFAIRYTSYLKSIENPDEILKKLILAMETVPEKPATTFYEACVSMYFFMLCHHGFEPGRLDVLLYPYYKNDSATSSEEAYLLIREMFSSIDSLTGHPGANHVTIGGSYADGSSSYNELTLVCIKAICGLRSPNLTLRVRRDMPENLWEASLDNISKGYSHPALVWEDLFIDGLINQYDIPMEDAVNYAFGGCSELLIQGKTCCDSTWVAYNMADILEHTMYNNLLNAKDFNEFYSIYKRDLSTTIKQMETDINLRQHAYGKNHSWPLQSLLTDGCIENHKSFNDGGTVYNFDSTNIYGSTNAINSLYTIKKIYENKLSKVSREDLLKAMASNYKGYEDVLAKCLNVKKFGNYSEEINEIAKDLMTHTFDDVKQLRCYRGNGRYMPAIILWVTWVEAGYRTGATPDGRLEGSALADSCGPMSGTDMEGPTSSLGAALSIPQKDCVGTCVINIRLDKSNFDGEVKREKTKNLIKAYLASGGCQIQINVVDSEDLKDALVNPEKHKDLIVRVGGFSDNFIYLNDDIKEQVILRNSL